MHAGMRLWGVFQDEGSKARNSCRGASRENGGYFYFGDSGEKRKAEADADADADAAVTATPVHLCRYWVPSCFQA